MASLHPLKDRSLHQTRGDSGFFLSNADDIDELSGLGICVEGSTTGGGRVFGGAVCAGTDAAGDPTGVVDVEVSLGIGVPVAGPSIGVYAYYGYAETHQLLWTDVAEGGNWAVGGTGGCLESSCHVDGFYSGANWVYEQLGLASEGEEIAPGNLPNGSCCS